MGWFGSKAQKESHKEKLSTETLVRFCLDTGYCSSERLIEIANMAEENAESKRHFQILQDAIDDGSVLTPDMGTMSGSARRSM